LKQLQEDFIIVQISTGKLINAFDFIDGLSKDISIDDYAVFLKSIKNYDKLVDSSDLVYRKLVRLHLYYQSTYSKMVLSWIQIRKFKYLNSILLLILMLSYLYALIGSIFFASYTY
jgi:hypothetical protein